MRNKNSFIFVGTNCVNWVLERVGTITKLSIYTFVTLVTCSCLFGVV